MTYTIRKATTKDLEVLLTFEQGVIEAERPMDPTIKEGKVHYYSIPELIQNEYVELLVAETNGSMVSCGYVRIKDDRHYLKHKKQGYLGFMYTVEEHRGKGLNKLIIDGLLDWCRSKGVFEIRLDVYDTNIPAIKAYEKVGLYKHMVTMRMSIDQENKNS